MYINIKYIILKKRNDLMFFSYHAYLNSTFKNYPLFILNISKGTTSVELVTVLIKNYE